MTCRKKITFSLVLLTLALILAVVFIPPAGSSLDEVEIADSTQVQQIVYQYGIPVDDYQVDYGIVQRNQTLSVILEQHGLTPRNVHDLTQKAKGIFDVRKIRAGQAYALFVTPDSAATPVFFVYEQDPKSYIVFDLRGD